MPHDNLLYLGVTQYHFHLFLFYFLEQFNSTEQWCLSLWAELQNRIFIWKIKYFYTYLSKHSHYRVLRLCLCFPLLLWFIPAKKKNWNWKFLFQLLDWSSKWVIQILPFISCEFLTYEQCIYKMMWFPFFCSFTLFLNYLGIKACRNPQLRSPGANAINLRLFKIMFREFNVQNVVCNICGDLLQKYQPKGPGRAKVPQDSHSHRPPPPGEKRACAEEGVDRKNLIPNGKRDKLSLNNCCSLLAKSSPLVCLD